MGDMIRILVTGGGTTAPIDAVRRITNVSTGRFAAAITEACLDQGASVVHLAAPNAELPVRRHAMFNLDAPDPAAEHQRIEDLRAKNQLLGDRLEIVRLEHGTVADYRDRLKEILIREPIDIAFLAAAVSDFEPEPVAGKIDSDALELVLRLRPTEKVIRSVRDWKPKVFLVGFKLLVDVEPEVLIATARQACLRNRADLTIANDLRSVERGAPRGLSRGTGRRCGKSWPGGQPGGRSGSPRVRARRRDSPPIRPRPTTDVPRLLTRAKLHDVL